MSQNQVGLIGPRSADTQDRKPKKDDFDRILEGLQIANGVLGIGVNFTTIQNHRAQTQVLEDARNGVVTRQQELDAGIKGMRPVAPGTDGAISYKVTGDGGELVDRAMIKPPTSPAPEKPMILPAGASLVQGGKIVTTAPKARGDGNGGAPLVQVETVDKDGNPIITFVRKQEGVSVPVSKPATAAAQKATNEAQYRYKSLIGNAAKLKQLVREHGTMELTGSAGSDMDRAIYEMAIDYAKLVDPESIAREGEVAAAQKYMLGFRNNLGTTTRNSTALEQIDGYLSGLNDRLKARASSYGDKSDQAIVDVQRSNKDASWLVEKANAAESGGDPEVTKYASEHSIDYDSAAKILISRGWKPK